MRNITLNAWDKITVLYNPKDCDGTSWQVHTSKGASGGYLSCTNGETIPSARISFTGVAVYYVSTFFDDQAILFRLDGVPSPTVSLAPPSTISANANVTKVMWSKEGLMDRPHTLELFPGGSQSTLTFDTIIYTLSESVEPSSSSTVLSPAFASSTPGTTGTTHTSAVFDTQTTGMIVGSVVGSISGLILLWLTILMCRRRSQLNAVRYYHSSSGPTVPSRILVYSQHQQTTQNSHLTRFSDSDLPSSSTAPHIRPLPPIPHGTSPRPLAHSPASHLDEPYEDSQPFRAVAHTSPVPTHTVDLQTDPDKQQYNESQRPLISHGGRVTSPSNLRVHVKLEPLRKATIRGDRF